MIPLKLQLRNFMCYRDPTLLDFAGIHLACLTGDNGHGKSALLDAITWALWGKARARYDDELVSLGEKEMEVEFEFSLGEVRYRVIRKRELARRSRSALEFQIADTGGFRSFTASTQRDTQARINAILRMDYDTFINSAFLVQGRADEFTVKQPAERKRILADILGLSVYDEYEQRAKDLAREKQQAEREVEARIQEIERELAHRPEYKRELKAARAQLDQLSGQAAAAEITLQELRGRVKTLEAKRAQLSDVGKRIRDAQTQLRQFDEQARARSERIAACESTLERREEIEAGHARLLRVREQEAACTAKLTQLLPLHKEKTRVEKQIAEARKSLELERHVAKQRLTDLAQVTEQHSALEAEHTRVCEELEELRALQTQAQGNREHIAELRSESAALEAHNEQLRLEMADLKEKMKLLQEPTATCPLCGQDLIEDDRLRLLTELKEDGARKGNLYRSTGSTLQENSQQITTLESEAARIERTLRRVPALQGREGTLRQSIEEAQRAATKLLKQRQLLAALGQRLGNGNFAIEEQAELTRLVLHIKDLGYDKTTHEKARQAMTELAHFETDKAELDKAQELITELCKNQQQMRKAHQQRTASLQADRRHHEELTAALAGFEELASELAAGQREVDELRRNEGRARQMVGAAQQKLDYCRYLARERGKRAKQLKDAAGERALYQELQHAFGKKGVQALIIESVIPEIEDEANALLGRMTEGRMSVHFDTQRDTKSGTTIETLDIKISDENGPRSYELYSGGEAFRIDFAIRIALSKLLARRAGAQLETLIIDEGFGTQDASGRQKLVEAINSIRDDFARIIVITHIEELKDAFPVRIDVFKTPRGSRLTVH